MVGALRSMMFLGRSLAADVLAHAARRVRPRASSEETTAQIAREIDVEVGKRVGEVTLSAKARAMIEVEPAADVEDEHAPPPPLKGSLEYRQRYGDRR